MDYLKRYGRELDRVITAVNIDDAGYFRGRSAFSLYEYPDTMAELVRIILTGFEGITEGPLWYQGDHMIFAQKGIPAIAVTTELLEEVMASVTHTGEDTPDKVDCTKLVEIAGALAELIIQFH